MLKTYLSLAKPRITMLVVVTALASAICAGRGDVRFSTSVLLVLSVGLASAGAAFLNNYFDRDIDAVMERTQNRPLAKRKINPGKVLAFGLLLIMTSILVALQINYLVALSALAGASVYVALYTLWLKRRSALNIVFGGLSGSCAVLAGWFAVTSQFSFMLVLIILLPLLWTPSHFWSFALVHQDSYRRASIPMLPVFAGEKKTAILILLATSLLTVVSLLLYFSGSFKAMYFTGAVVLGVLFLGSSVRLWLKPGKERAWTNFKFSGIYLFALFLIMVFDKLIQ